MELKDRLAAFEKLGKYLGAIDEGTFSRISGAAASENSWFTPQSVQTAIRGVSHMLAPQALNRWVSAYSLQPARSRVVAVVMAGNIPLVGFHDLLSVLISGHRIQIKYSSKDKVLMSFTVEKLIEIEPRFSDLIQVADQLRAFDAVIATGSDNSSRYFEFYFGKYPHIIRRNRTSCAVLTGTESGENLVELGKDVFTYFGLGCRNVSKLFVPAGYNFQPLLDSWSSYGGVMTHHKYHNNYDYQKSILLVNRQPFLDNGFVLLSESEKTVSPISALYYEAYADDESLLSALRRQEDKIQCVVGNTEIATVAIGEAQFPNVWDYADRIDTLRFLQEL